MRLAIRHGVAELSLVVMLAGAVLPAAAGHWMWGTYEAGRLHRLIHQYQAAGEPIFPEDFTTKPVPDDKNAVVDLRPALAAVAKDGQALDDIDFTEEPRPISQAAAQNLAKQLEPFGKALDAVPVAMKKPEVDWQLKWARPVFATVLPDISPLRTLTRLLRARAVMAHGQGDSAQAVAVVQQMMWLSKATAKQPFLICGLVAFNQRQSVTSEVQLMSPALSIGAGKGQATPEQVRALIKELLDDASSRQTMIYCLRGERMLSLDCCMAVAEGIDQKVFDMPRTKIGGYLVKPIAMGDAVIIVRQETQAMRAAAAADWPSAQKQLPSKAEITELNPGLHFLAQMFAPNVDRAVLTAYRTYTEERLAAVALAARWYAVEHDGKLPPTLNDLVPKYLPEVPLDPMADGKPLGCIVNKDRAIVYSVGTSGTDQQGSEAPLNPKHPDDGGPRSWTARNYVVPLDKAP